MSERKLPDDFWTVEIAVDPFAMAPDVGADLALIEAHEAELETIVQQMWSDMTTETKLLDGVEVPEQEELVIPRISEEEFRVALASLASLNGRVAENEPSQIEETKE